VDPIYLPWTGTGEVADVDDTNLTLKQVTTVMVASARIAAAAQIDQSYSPGGASVDPGRSLHRYWCKSQTSTTPTYFSNE